jgi:DNA polymerase-3 subunit delta
LIFEAEELDQRRKLFKILLEHALVVSVNLSDEKDEDKRLMHAIASCRAFLPKMAQELGVTLEPAVVEDLAEATNGSLALARSELEKLALYVGERRRITAEDVEHLVASARQYSVWQFAGILAQRNRAQALAFLRSVLQEGEQPEMVVGALAWMYRRLLEVQELPHGLNAGMVAGKLRMRYDTAELALREAPRIPRERLVAGLHALAEADSRLKSGNPDDAALMEFLATQLTA